MEDMDNGMGEFVYLGVAEGIRKYLNLIEQKSDTISLMIGIDGMPIFASGYQDLWPIMAKIYSENDIYQPFCVAIYLGKSKPKSIEDFLKEFINEMNVLYLEKLNIEGRQFLIEIKCFVADTPARAFLKCIKGHTGYYACERCPVKGKKIKLIKENGKKGSKVIFPISKKPERSDASFRNQTQPQHHHKKTPLCKLIQKPNMVTCFPLDGMHLISGVTKRIIGYLTQGRSKVKLKMEERLEFSNRINMMKSDIPCEFQRKPRSLKYFKKWKATEFRFFLLYSGPIILKNIVDKKIYNHFLLLHVAFRILCDKELVVQWNSTAKHYLTCFFKLLSYYYGKESLVMNMHNLIHVADDTKNMHCTLSEIMAFCFENYLGKMKRMIRGGNRVLSQLCRRIHEKDFAQNEKPASPPVVEIIEFKTKSGGIEIKKLKYKGFTISNEFPNNVVLTEKKKL